MDQVQDPRGIARLASAAAWTFLLCCMASLAGAIYFIGLLGGLGQPIAGSAALRTGTVALGAPAIAYALMYLLTGLAVARWLYVTNRNAQAWSAHVSITPGWAVGWFVVPIANLYKPFEGIRETFQASVDPVEPASVPSPFLLRLWWGVWLGGNIMSGVSNFLARQRGLPSIIADLWWQAATMAVVAGQTLLLLAVIRLITRTQRNRLPNSLDEVFS